MAESESGGERTEDPSAKRLQDAREKGQIPRSRELGNFATMIGGSAVLFVLGASLAGRLELIMRRGFEIDARSLADPDSMLSSLGQAAIGTMFILMPVFGVVVVLSLLAAIAVGGWNFSPQALGVDFSRMNPLSGLQRLVGLQGLGELMKAVLKCLVVGGVCYAIAKHQFDPVMALAHMAPRTAIGRSAELLAWAFVWLCGSLAVVAAVDVPLQLFEFNRNLRMTRQELKDEAKESDGRPETKQRIRQMQQALARRRMMHKVPKADVVIMNPTHFAVALKYDPENMRAPRLLAKGRDLVALNIRRIAEEHHIAVFESPKLARALYRSTDLDHEIPAGLYMAVAQVLSYVFRVRSMTPTKAARVQRPDPVVGDEYEEV